MKNIPDKIRAMEYTPKGDFDILAHGVYKAVPYWIISRGTHPCAYLEVKMLGRINVDEVDCHGGITYDEPDLSGIWDKNTEGFDKSAKRFIGWDYAHGGDYYCGDRFTLGGHQYTTEEMIAEAKSVIDDLFQKFAEKVRNTTFTDIPESDRGELVREYFSEILRQLTTVFTDEIFEDLNGDLVKKYGTDEVARLLNFPAFADVVKIGVREKYGVELEL